MPPTPSVSSSAKLSNARSTRNFSPHSGQATFASGSSCDTSMSKLTVQHTDAGQRLDRFLVQALPAFSRSRLQALIRDGFVTVNGNAARPRDLVRAGDVIEWREPEISKIEAQPEPMDLEILFEDDDLLVLNKP